MIDTCSVRPRGPSDSVHVRAAGGEGLTTGIASMQPTVTRLMAAARIAFAPIVAARIARDRTPCLAYPHY